jgi:hypothetical protein
LAIRTPPCRQKTLSPSHIFLFLAIVHPLRPSKP